MSREETNSKKIRFLAVCVIILALIVLYTQYQSFINNNFNKYVLNHYSEVLFDSDNDLNENEIIIGETDLNVLNQNFAVYNSEFSVCYKVYSVDPLIIVPSKTTIHKQSETSLLTECSSDSIMIIHSHPNGVCQFSETDLETFIDSDYWFLGVICGYNDFKIINRERVTQNLVVA